MTQSVNLAEYTLAMKTVKRFKNLFLLLILVSVLFQANSFILLEFTHLLEPSESETSAESEDPSFPPGLVKPTPPTPKAAEVYLQVMRWALPITKFLALACGVMLAISLMFAAGLSLLGRGQGTPQVVGAFFWSVILLSMVIPWQQVYASSVACGALYSAMELQQARDLFRVSDKTALDVAFFYGRFLAYPALAFVIWWIVAVKFAGGYRRMTAVEPKPTSVGM
ncbi:MAG: hypothetical protein JW849_00950 [Phycisphaerae bacterium]|nr:hypothetical protein [Phycisphaerae bacterium]